MTPRTKSGAARPAAELQGYVTFRVAGQWLGIPVGRVQEVLTERVISSVPLAPPEISGFMSLRGQMVTVIDVHSRLGLPGPRAAGGRMNVVVHDQGELFSLVVDEIGDVVVVRAGQVEAAVPATVSAHWRACCDRVVRLPDGPVAVLDVGQLLSIDGATRR